MTKFLDGPAAGQKLMIKRATVFMRVVQNGAGKWDALDQLEDIARPDEKIFAYKINGSLLGHCHINAGKRSGFYPIAEYKFIDPQPDDATMRNNAKWVQWLPGP